MKLFFSSVIAFFRCLPQFPTAFTPTDDLDSMDIEFPSLFPTTPTTTTVDDNQDFSDFFSMDAGANWLCDTESWWFERRNQIECWYAERRGQEDEVTDVGEGVFTGSETGWEEREGGLYSINY